MPMAMPQPGTRDIKLTSADRLLAAAARHAWLACSSRCQLLHDEDRAGGDEGVEQRDLDEPLPREAHELVDAYARQGATHPDEDEGEGERLDHEPEQADDDLERQERPDQHDRYGDDIEQHEGDDQRLQETPAALERPHHEREPEDQERHADDERPQQPDVHSREIERRIDRDVEEVEDGLRVDRRVPATEEQGRGESGQDEYAHVLGEEEEAEAHAAVFRGE